MNKAQRLSIEAINNYYFSDTTKSALNDYLQVQKIVAPKEPSPVVFGELPAWNGDVKKEYEKGDHACANAILAMAILNGPTDIEEFVSAAKEIRERFGGPEAGGYDYKRAQHPFTFFRGTILHEYLNPNSENRIDKDWALRIRKADKNLFDTKFGAWICRKLKIGISNFIETDIKDLDYSSEFKSCVDAYVIDAPNEFADLTARALLRTTKFGVLTLGGLGALHAAYRIKEGKDPKEELAKAAVDVATTIAAVGYLGAAGNKYFGTLGSITGTAVGLAVATASHQAAEKLFE